jgi:hypothetical protein
LFFVSAIGLSIYKIRDLKTVYSIEQFTNPHHDLYAESKKVIKQFNIVQDIPIMILLKTKAASWALPEQVSQLESITKQIGAIPEVAEIKSLSNTETAIASESTFTVGYIKDFIQDVELQKKILNDPLIAPHFISNDGQYAALILEIPLKVTFDKKVLAMKKIESILLNDSKHFSYQIGGPGAITTEMTKLLEKEILIYSVLSILASAFVFFMLFRSVRVILLCLTIIGVSNLIALALMALFKLPLTVLSCSVPIVVTLTVIAILSQNLTIMCEFNKILEKRHRFLLNFHIHKKLFSSHWLCTTTTCIGFGTLLWSDLPVMNDYGLSVIVALVSATMVSMALFTAGMMWIPIPVKRKWSIHPHYFSTRIVKYDKYIFFSILTIITCSASLAGYLNWSMRLFDDLPASHPSRIATEAAEVHMGGVIPLNISIGSKNNPEYWKHNDNLEKLNEMVQRWKTQPTVGSVLALSDFINASQSSRRLASTDRSISETYLIYSMADENPVDFFTTPNYQYARVSLRLKDVPSLHTQQLLVDLKKDIKTTFPDSEFMFSGIGSYAHAVNESVSRNLIYGFNSAMLWIVFILIFVFRSLRWALVTVIPNLVSPAMLLGLLALSQTPIKPGIAIVFSISLGIAFGNSIYILMELKDMLRKNPAKHKLPIVALLDHELAPCFNSALAAMAIFSVFLFSTLSMNVTFGIFMIVSVATGMCGDLFLMPAALSLFPRLLIKKAKGAN